MTQDNFLKMGLGTYLFDIDFWRWWCPVCTRSPFRIVQFPPQCNCSWISQRCCMLWKQRTIKLRSHTMKSLKALQTRLFILLYRRHCMHWNTLLQ